MLRRLAPNLLLALLSVLITYSVLECTYRVYKRLRLTQDARYYFQAIETPLYLFDRDIGYRYRPNVELRFTQFDPDNNLLLSNKIRVNNCGHIAPTNDVIPKPRSEFRIAVLGNSFTACITNDVPWPSILEDILNTDDSLKGALNVSTFKVINFGMDGTGIVQWARVYDHEVRRFDPDLVVVNFITDDIRRKFIYRTTVPLHGSATDYSLTLTSTSLPVTLENRDCLLVRVIVMEPRVLDDNAEISRIKQALYEERMRRLPWFTPYPELLARALGYRFGLHGRLRPANDFTLYYDTQEEAVRAALAALQTIVSQHPRVLLLHNPVYDELDSKKTPSTLFALMRKAPHLKIQPMIEFLPVQTSELQIKQWFNLPSDSHFSNYGAAVYARAVYNKIRCESGLSRR